MSKTKEKSSSPKWEKLADLHPLIIVFVIIVLLAGATYFIPGGEYARHEVAIGALGGDTREVINPNSFQYTESNPQGFSDLWTSFIGGALEAADISFLIMICAGAFTAIIATGSITTGINSLVKKFGTKSYIIIPICVYAFGLAAATAGIYEEAIPFIMVLVPLMVSMGFDSMSGLMIIHFGVATGSAFAFVNPYNVGVGQALAEVPMMSGIGVRIVMWVVAMGLTSAYILRYALKVKANPKLSSCYESDLVKKSEYEEYNVDNLEGLSGRGILVLLLTFAGLGLIVYGVLKQSWWFEEIASVFLFMGIIIPLVGGLKINQLINQFLEGMSSVLSAVLLISASRVITKILEDSNTMDTMLHGLSNVLADMPKVICVIVMFAVASIAMLFIQSSSGLAAALMPIMAPLADILKIPRQIVVSAYAFGTGTFGWVAPWEGINYAMCTMAGVDFFKYLKEAIKFVFIVYIPTAVVGLILMTIFNYGA
ncbi:MAG: Na+/H+ antiporter NhaC family protein [Anaerovoracaceae bacterium]